MMPDLEAVIPCSEHGKMNEHCRQHEVCMAKGRMTPIHYELHAAFHHCPGGRRVRLVEVQPDQAALAEYIIEEFDDYSMATHAHDMLRAAVPGPTYRIEEVE